MKTDEEDETEKNEGIFYWHNSWVVRIIIIRFEFCALRARLATYDMFVQCAQRGFVLHI